MCETLSKYYAIAMTYHPAVFNIKTSSVLNPRYVFNIKTKEVPRWTTITDLFSAASIFSPHFSRVMFFHTNVQTNKFIRC